MSLRNLMALSVLSVSSITSSWTALSLAASRPPRQWFQKRLGAVRRWETSARTGARSSS